ncbi:probable ATP-dependent RNA helicase DDX52 isoform X2 [Planococcus citri]|uniref:probable ATP-dependent RNA helicase DDX52 isoform X2 n=1 Tax=Planococcus citri TaxID=170843 RepID=UPI0031F7CA57
MDTDDIFAKLSFGAVFHKTPSKKTPSTKIEVKSEPSIKSEPEPEPEPQSSDEGSKNITLLGNISSESNKKSSKSKKKKAPKEDVEKNKQLLTEKINHFRNLNHINISGENIPNPIQNFDELADQYDVSTNLIQNVKNCGYSSPTPIQMQAIPVMLKGKQILACAPTGSGKTAAFLIPIIHHLNRPKNVGFRAVIISPTRELSRQTYRECERLCEGTDLRIHITTKIKDTVKKSVSGAANKYDILVTTPNRLVYLLNQEPPSISLKSVEWLIIDESDKLFETGIRGFRDQLAVIYQACDSTNIKRAMFSATYTTEVAKWSRKNLKDLALVTIGHRNTTVESVEQQLIYVGKEEGKLIAMRDLIRQGISPPVLIFLQSKERARELFQELLYDGINVDVIHADRTQLQRDNAVKAFREGKIWVLICTELLGRGIDFKGVNLVINYDFPPTAISYIHRIGRTGRAGRKGKAVTFFTDDDAPYLKSVVNVMKESGCEVPEFMLSLKKIHKKIRKKMETKLPDRGDVASKPHRYKSFLDKQKKEKLGKTENTTQNDAKKTKKRKNKNQDVNNDKIKKKKT